MVKDYLSDLAVDAAQNWFKGKLDVKKLKCSLADYIERQQKYNRVCTLASEIDFQGLVEYIDQSLLEAVTNRLFAPNSQDRKRARDDIVSAAVARSKAETPQAKHRVASCILTCLDIVRSFYASNISMKDYILASEIVDAVKANTQEALETSTHSVISRIDCLENHIATGSLFSIDKAVQLAEQGDLPVIESEMQKFLNHILVTHPMYPDFGCAYNGKMFQSKPLNEDAKRRFPPRYVLTGAVRFGNTYYNDPDNDPLDYSYRHQLPMVMEVSKAVKYLGNRRDPIQSEVEQLPGSVVLATPPQFPPAFPCSIKVGNKVFFEPILLRTQEILDNGIYVIGNKEQNICVHVEVKINPQMPHSIDFSISINQPNNREMLNYVMFMDALSQEKDLHIHVLDAGQDIIAGYINDIGYKTGFTSVEEEIDFLDRICIIEDYFNVNFNLPEIINGDEYRCVIRISDLIKNDRVLTTWKEVTFTGTVDKQLREALINADTELYMLSYIGINEVELFGTSFEFRFMRSFNCANIVDYEKIKTKVAILDDGDIIKVMFRAGEDSTAIDTLNIPNEMIQMNDPINNRLDDL